VRHDADATRRDRRTRAAARTTDRRSGHGDARNPPRRPASPRHDGTRVCAPNIEVPETGTPAERLKKLWQATRPHLLADAKAALSDAEYQKRRAPIWSAWIQLQMSVAGDDDQVDRIIPDVLGLLIRLRRPKTSSRR
jgi:hypothetical protein